LPLEKIGTKAKPASDVLDPKLIEALENFEESVSPTAT